MKINFNINFHTVWGQTLYVIGSIPELGSWNTSMAKEMQYTGEGNWAFELDLPGETVYFEYRYFLSSNNKLIFEEWQKNHKFNITDSKQDYVLIDYWQNRPQNMAFYSSAFIKSLFAHPCDKFERVVKSKKKILLKVLAPEIKRDKSLAVLGNQAELGNWNTNKALILACDNFPEWSVEFDATEISYPIEYKFCIINNEDKSLELWEKGDNRFLNIPSFRENETVIISGLQFQSNLPEWKCAGTVVPVFSLRSENSFGIGDFGDLRKFVDWLKLTNQKVLQVLPVNDTTMTHTWRDSYPYNSISIYALHPIYLNLDLMGQLKDEQRRSFYSKKQEELNSLPNVDYDQVNIFKWRFFHEIFEQEGEKTLKTPEFLEFFEKNKEWLTSYAAYSYLRDKYKTPDFHLWEEYRYYNKAAIETLASPDKSYYSEITIHYYLQFQLHIQLSVVRDYAYSKGIILKGDIPIGISRESVEAWKEPHFFNINFQTGAPPDDFSLTGQNWGFPTYNWEVMEADNYNWWKKRFAKMSDYFDAYRIDHILGFFRIWEIPVDSVQGLLGYFNPALPLSIEEIENAGFIFKLEKYTNAHINEQFLPDLFGEYTQEVIQTYLNRTSSHHFALKEKFNTQLKIQQYFKEVDDYKINIIREGLYAICNEVLFIKDKNIPELFHPRILASSSYIYKELDNADKYAFDYLYWNYFYQRHNEFWKEQGYNKLTPLIASTEMLVCGEDLGMIPHSVPEVMQKLQIFSLEIERMPKEANTEFTNLQHLPYHSVCTTSTHDMSTIRMWWEENRPKIQRYYNEILKHEGIAPEICTVEVCEQIISNHLNTRSMLTIIPIQDWLSLDGRIRRENEKEERINIPAHPRHYWRYRMHISIEELLRADKLNNKINELISKTDR